jgi:DNA polymerase III, epsilon subunit and related 3''-5'' exonucleases
MRFVAIDFETANSFVGSICAVGLVIMDGTSVEESRFWLVKPHRDCSRFDPFNVAIHGIREKDVAGAPEFGGLYLKEILPRIAGNVVAAHNAAFDMSALRHVLGLYHIEHPDIRYLCTYKASARTWEDLENHRLDTVSKFLSFEFKHHDALEDALACANILLEVFRRHQTDSLDALLRAIGMRPGRLLAGGYEPCSISRDCLKVAGRD